MNKAIRSEQFKDNNHGRFWWFHQNESNFIPPIFSFLDDKEWRIIKDWYIETEKLNFVGECNIPTISFLQGIIMGNSIKNIVQLGNYVGFSSLLIGFMMRKMGFKNSFITIDKDSHSSSICQYWINKSNLNDYVKILKMNSWDHDISHRIAIEFDEQDPNLVFINSSYEYYNTLQELEIWYRLLSTKGIIVMHNANEFAAQYDLSKKGGVSRALKEWSQRTNVNYFVINESIETTISYSPDQLTYKDLGGLALIQKS